MMSIEMNLFRKYVRVGQSTLSIPSSKFSITDAITSPDWMWKDVEEWVEYWIYMFWSSDQMIY